MKTFAAAAAAPTLLSRLAHSEYWTFSNENLSLLVSIAGSFRKLGDYNFDDLREGD